MALENLRQLMEERGVRQIELAELFGRDKSVITHLMQGKRQLKAEEALKLAQHFKVPVSMILDETPVQGASGLSEPMRVPFHAPPRQHASSPQVTEENGAYFLQIESAAEDAFALEVADDGMNLAGVMAGDIVIASLKATCREGDVVVAQRYEGDGAVSIVRKYQGNQLMAMSTNPNHHSYRVDEDDVRLVAPVTRLVRLY